MTIDLTEKQMNALAPSLNEMQALKQQYAQVEQKLNEVITGIVSYYDYKEGSRIELNIDKKQIIITEPVVPNRSAKRAINKNVKKK